MNHEIVKLSLNTKFSIDSVMVKELEPFMREVIISVSTHYYNYSFGSNESQESIFINDYWGDIPRFEVQLKDPWYTKALRYELVEKDQIHVMYIHRDYLAEKAGIPPKA